MVIVIPEITATLESPHGMIAVRSATITTGSPEMPKARIDPSLNRSTEGFSCFFTVPSRYDFAGSFLDQSEECRRPSPNKALKVICTEFRYGNDMCDQKLIKRCARDLLVLAVWKPIR